MSRRARREYRRAYQKEYRRRTGGGDGSSQALGDVKGMKDLFKALAEVQGNVAVRVRRKALQTTANELTKSAKAATPQFDIAPSAKATLRRAIFRKDPKTIERVGAKGKARKSKPMRYTVAVRRGKSERAGADLGKYSSGAKKGQSKGQRKHSRDAWWWAFFEKGADNRKTKKGYGRGTIRAQGVFKKAFDSASTSAIAKGEKAGFAELQKILKRQAQKAKTKP